MSHKKTRKRRLGRPPEPEKKTAIIDSVRHVFGEHGYHGVSLDKLARAAGMHKAGILHHFGSKEELYCAVMVSLVDELLMQLKAIMRGNASYRARLTQMSEVMTRYFLTKPDVAKLLLREGLGDGPFMKNTSEQLILRLAKTTEAFIGLGIDDGEFVEQDPKAAFLAIGGYLLVLYGAPAISRDVIAIDAPSEAVIQRESTRFEAFMMHLLCGAEKH